MRRSVLLKVRSDGRLLCEICTRDLEDAVRSVPTGPPARHRRSASLTNWAEEDRIRCQELTGKDETMNDARTIDDHPAQLSPRATTPEALVEIEKRVLWLATSMIHHANRVRPNPTGLKVGGHQASCASMVSIMTSLWFEQLRPGDRAVSYTHLTLPTTERV